MKCLVGNLTYQSCDHPDNTQHTLSLPRSNSEIDFIFGKEFKTICRCVSLGGHIVGAPRQDILGGSVAQQLRTRVAAAIQLWKTEPHCSCTCLAACLPGCGMWTLCNNENTAFGISSVICNKMRLTCEYVGKRCYTFFKCKY